jgi:predicted TIM-barrel fold metal-dependent hydrolase
MPITFDQISTGKRPSGGVTFLPEPARRDRSLVVLSVDDHLVEPPHTFDGRMPSRFGERAPHVVDLPDGGQAWRYDAELLPNIGMNAFAGRPRDQWSSDPTRFEEMRRGSWDIHARIKDMDLDGVYASMCFPSFLPGFGGIRLQTATKDLDLALAAVRAWNDWVAEEWAGSYPDRIVPLGITWLHDPEIGAEEVRRNAARGFRALAFPEVTDPHGWPSIHTSHWDPIFAACEETDTVLCLHVGSGGGLPPCSPGAPPDVPAVLFGTYASLFAVEWLYSLVAVRFPRIKICLSEGGIGWVASLLDRLEHMVRYDDMLSTWHGIDVTPAEVLRRNFWFCALDDPSAWVHRYRIGVEHIMVEVDYPHGDGTWPDTQASLRRQLDGLDPAEVERFTWRNASELLRFAVPEHVRGDPDAFGDPASSAARTTE